MARKPVMAFISNLRTLDDMVKLYPPDWHARVQAARQSPGYIASPPFDVCGRAIGYLVLMLRSGREVMSDMPAACALTLEMTRFVAEDLDGDVIGLGSLTTSVTDGGRIVADFIDRHGWKLRATHGDAGSVAAICDCLDLVRLKPTDKVGVVGAYGVIGTALSRLLAQSGQPLLLVGRRPDKLRDLELLIMAETGRRPLTSLDITSLSSADCIVTVTSHPTSLLAPTMVHDGAVIVDPAVPANVTSSSLWNDPSRALIVVSNASQVRVPGLAVSSAMFGTFDEPDGCATTYACLAETSANALFGDSRHHVGTIDLSFVVETRQRFAQLGFAHAVPRMFGSDARQLLQSLRP